MARTDNLTNFLTDVADAIREKKGTTDNIPASNFDTEISELSGGADLSEYFTETISAGSASVGGYTHMIKKIPSTVTISGTSCNYMFAGYKGTEIPALDTSNITLMRAMFQNSLVENIPNLNTSNVTNMQAMFYGCSITVAPTMDTTNVTTMGEMFYGSSIVNAPELDTQNVTNMSGMFRGCDNLKTVPSYNTSNVTNMSQMFYTCRKLEQVGTYNTQNVTNMSGMFQYVDKLTTIPTLDTSKVTNMSNMFYGNGGYSEVPLFDCGSVTNVAGMFTISKSKVTTLGGFKDLGKAYLTTQSANYSQYTLDLSPLPNITEQSIINVLDNLYDIASKGCNTQKVVFGTDNLNKLTSEAGQTALANARAKGWAVS